MHGHDQASHDTIASKMIYWAIVGAEPIAHPEIQAFLKGFSLPCANGFTFLEVCYSNIILLIAVLTMTMI